MKIQLCVLWILCLTGFTLRGQSKFFIDPNIATGNIFGSSVYSGSQLSFIYSGGVMIGMASLPYNKAGIGIQYSTFKFSGPSSSENIKGTPGIIPLYLHYELMLTKYENGPSLFVELGRNFGLGQSFKGTGFYQNNEIDLYSSNLYLLGFNFNSSRDTNSTWHVSLTVSNLPIDMSHTIYSPYFTTGYASQALNTDNMFKPLTLYIALRLGVDIYTKKRANNIKKNPADKYL